MGLGDSVSFYRFVTSLLISGVGAATFTFHTVHISAELGAPLAVLTGSLLPMVISVGLIISGGWLLWSDVDAAFDHWIVIWTVFGIVAITVTGSFVSFYQSTHGTQLTDMIFMYANWFATGALAGFLLGVYDVRRRTVQRELRVERDRLAEKERALARENERLDTFASIVSHDLRNPLNIGQGYVTLLRENPDTAIEPIENALHRMEAIIDDVLTMAREGEEVSPRDLPVVRLSSIADSSWEMVSTTEATLRVEGEFTVRADKDRLRHVFENLFRNAIDHGGTAVTVSVGPLPEGAGFYVEDDGQGIETDEDIFEAGYSTKSEGTGLGLMIVKTIVTAHGWEIGLAESETGGARFEISGVESS